MWLALGKAMSDLAGAVFDGRFGRWTRKRRGGRRANRPASERPAAADMNGRWDLPKDAAQLLASMAGGWAAKLICGERHLAALLLLVGILGCAKGFSLRLVAANGGTDVFCLAVAIPSRDRAGRFCTSLQPAIAAAAHMSAAAAARLLAGALARGRQSETRAEQDMA